MAKSIKQIRQNAPGYHTHALGGPAQQRRASEQQNKKPQGLQVAPKTIYEAAVNKVKEKMKNKPGKTDTGQRANPVNTEPEHKMMTGYH